MKKYLKEKRFYIFILCLIIFLILSILVLKNGVLNIDNNSYLFIKNNLINESLTKVVKLFTNLGGALVLIMISLLMLLFVKDKKTVLIIIINLIIAFLFNDLLKHIFVRSRPDSINWLVTESGYSFPSGHAMVSMAYYGYLIYLLYLSKNKYKWLLITLSSIIILLIGISRIYLGVHYLSDVLAGFLVAIIYLTIFITVSEYINDSTHS